MYHVCPLPRFDCAFRAPLISCDGYICHEVLRILIDVHTRSHAQVESLTAARSAAMGGNEPSDAIRVVNAVLTQVF